jgi:hypothetical protein
MALTIDYQIGDIIEYVAFTNELRRVKVTLRDQDIAKGKPGFEGVALSGPTISNYVWGYDSQVKRVIPND